LDISNPAQPFAVKFETSLQNGSYALTATVPWNFSGTHTLLALSDDALAQPAAMLQHHPSSLHSAQAGAEVVMVSPPQFVSAIHPLAALRQSEGHTVALVNVDDVYDEFNFGERTPFAIRNFLQTAAATWTNKPKYLLLAGDASVDPRNYFGFGFFDFIPTRII